MRVYKISSNATPPRGRFKEYADLDIKESDVGRLRLLGVGRPYPREWKPIILSIRTPRAPRPDFYGFASGSLICNERALELAGEALEMAGELLPITIQNEPGQFYIFNATNCINVLDSERTTWDYLGPNKEFRKPGKPVFIAERFGEESIFKYPEDGGVGIYCLERSGSSDDAEFKALVEEHWLTGLEFKEVWNEHG